MNALKIIQAAIAFIINADRIADIKRKAELSYINELMGMFENVLSAKEKIENNVNPKLALSAMFKNSK
jgi:hypothetical protein